MDQPTNDGVNTYFVSRAARQAGLTVVLSGLGGDEIFSGYRHHRRVENLCRVPAPLQRTGLRVASMIGRRLGERWARLSPLYGQTTAQNLYIGFRGFFAPEQVCRLLNITVGEVSTVAESLWTGLDCDIPRKWPGPTAFRAFEMPAVHARPATSGHRRLRHGQFDRGSSTVPRPPRNRKGRRPLPSGDGFARN